MVDLLSPSPDLAEAGRGDRVYLPESVNGNGRMRIWVRSSHPQRQLMVRLEVFSSKPVTFREFFDAQPPG